MGQSRVRDKDRQPLSLHHWATDGIIRPVVVYPKGFVCCVWLSLCVLCLESGRSWDEEWERQISQAPLASESMCVFRCWCRCLLLRHSHGTHAHAGLTSSQSAQADRRSTPTHNSFAYRLL